MNWWRGDLEELGDLFSDQVIWFAIACKPAVISFMINRQSHSDTLGILLRMKSKFVNTQRLKRASMLWQTVTHLEISYQFLWSRTTADWRDWWTTNVRLQIIQRMLRLKMCHEKFDKKVEETGDNRKPRDCFAKRSGGVEICHNHHVQLHWFTKNEWFPTTKKDN